ncbi:MAG TPA: hypothetical protein VM286_03170 [Candidatus Thermoplasmatota archaeon]|nr:hypothetical protein [Candidatus Thermoplasmatota archaeon]
MSRKLAFLPLLLLALLPLGQANAQALDDLTLTLGAVKGVISEDSLGVVPYKGNLTVAVEVRAGCAAIARAVAADPEIDHIDVAVVNPPAWMNAEAQDIEMDPKGCIGSIDGYQTVAGEYKIGLGPGAPGILPQSVNLTASLEGVDDSESAPKQLQFKVQFHGNYTLTPSVQFPLKVTGNQANFTVTLTNTGNSRNMIMVEDMHASTGAFSGLGSEVYDPPKTVTLPVVFKAPAKCWTNATVQFTTATHYLTLSQLAGSYHEVRHYSWDFTNAEAGNCKDTKSSPLGGWVLVSSILGAAFVARRRHV